MAIGPMKFGLNCGLNCFITCYISWQGMLLSAVFADHIINTWNMKKNIIHFEHTLYLNAP